MFPPRDINIGAHKYSECPSRILMRRRKNLLRHRMRSNGGNTYKSRGKGCALSPSNGLPRGVAHRRRTYTHALAPLLPSPSPPPSLCHPFSSLPVQCRPFESTPRSREILRIHADMGELSTTRSSFLYIHSFFFFLSPFLFSFFHCGGEMGI